jgi:hypothetical protein
MYKQCFLFFFFTLIDKDRWIDFSIGYVVIFFIGKTEVVAVLLLCSELKRQFYLQKKSFFSKVEKQVLSLAPKITFPPFSNRWLTCVSTKRQFSFGQLQKKRDFQK